MIGVHECSLDTISVDEILNMAEQRKLTYTAEGYDVTWRDYEDFKELLHEKGEYSMDSELAHRLGL